MRIAICECEACDDEWHIPSPGELSASAQVCDDCGDVVSVEYLEVF